MITLLIIKETQFEMKEYSDYKSGEKLPDFAKSGIKKFQEFLVEGNDDMEFKVLSKRVCLEKHDFDFNWPGIFVKVDGEKHFISLSDLETFNGENSSYIMSTFSLYMFTDQESLDMLYAELKREAEKPGGF